jgi:colanic acid biosynthesis glycosyl transferase WcaI
MKRVFLIICFFVPDHSANSQLLGDLAFHLASAGREVHVITSRQLYEDPRARLPHAETISGVHVHRLSSSQFGRSRLIGRSIDCLSFYLTLLRSVFKLLNPGDILITTTDPPPCFQYSHRCLVSDGVSIWSIGCRTCTRRWRLSWESRFLTDRLAEQ